MASTFVIDCFPASAARYVADHAIVAVDVIRATTLVVTAVAEGRRCLLASNLDDAFALRARLGDALLAGELAGDMPAGFDMNNSPSGLALREEAHRPLVTLSTSGTELMLAASGAAYGAQAACLRNFSAAARHVAKSPAPIAIIGAGSRGEFRIEDQLCCAWVAQELMQAGHAPADARTAEIIERWNGAEVTAIDTGNSVGYLRRSGQARDRDFVVSHVDDVDLVCVVEGNEVRSTSGLRGMSPVAPRQGADHSTLAGRLD
jgi:2-phosphosulfolactate phosphatase